MLSLSFARRPLLLPCIAALGCSLSGCAVVGAAASVASTAVSVAGTVVSTGVSVTGKVVEKAIDVAIPDDPAPQP